MPHLVVGTAGHIDHGKSALVRALTGIDPDRLDEEKRRGITIELGFADLDLGGGDVISFVDVPGHERFVRHMVAGATGVDAVLLVIAADQGVQPQTIEHLAICRLLDVHRGIVVLSKCDLVEPDLRQVVALEVRDLLAGSFLESAPVIEVSARTGVGLAELSAALGALARHGSQRNVAGLVRLPIDRSFVMRGFGAVVTGTLVSGTLHEGDDVVVLPGESRGRVRGLQVHRAKVSSVEAGHRAAVNLQGLDSSDAPRGATLTRPGEWRTTRRVWARISLLPGTPSALATRGGPVRFHHGTVDVAGRLRVLAREGEGSLHAELRLVSPIVAAPGDRFILRRPAPVDTLGGGVIVDAAPPGRREATSACFAPQALEIEHALTLRLLRAGAGGMEPAVLARDLGCSLAQLEQESGRQRGAGGIVEAASRWFDGATCQALEARILEALERFHADEPLRAGMSREALRGRLAPAMPQDAWRALLGALARRGRVQLEGEDVALGGHRIELDESDRALAERIEARFRDAGLDPPTIESVIASLERARAAPILDWLLAEGRLVRIQDRRLFHARALEAMRLRLRQYAATSRTIDVAAFKELAGVTRKNAIPLLEQLDAERATRRVGNNREILLEPEA